MNEHETERIAAAMHQLRPDWPVSSLRTLIAKKLADRPRRDVAVALAWVACEPNSATPARVLEAGPWWRAAAVEGQANRREPYDPAKFCGTCGKPEMRCKAIPAYISEHEFTSAIATVRAAVPAPTPAPEDLADRTQEDA